MAEEPCVTYLSLDSMKNPPIMTIPYDNRYTFIENPVKADNRKQDKSTNNLPTRKPRRSRTIFTPEQVAELKYYFLQCSYIKLEKAEQIATKFSMPVGVVKVWFKNQRRKLKIRESEKRFSETINEKPRYKPHEFILPMAPPSSFSTPTPTQTSSISPINIKLSYGTIHPGNNPNVKQELTYSPAIRQEINYNPGVKQEIPYNPYPSEAAYQWLQSLPTITPGQMVFNPIPQHHAPQQMQSYPDTVITFNPLPYYTLPSPASTTSGDANHMTANSDTSDYFSQMSPNSEITEPLTPNSNNGEAAESVFNGILDSLKTPETEPPIETVFEELTSAPQPGIKTEPCS